MSFSNGTLPRQQLKGIAFTAGPKNKSKWKSEPLINPPPPRCRNSRPHRTDFSFPMAIEEAEARPSGPPPSHGTPPDDDLARSQVPNASSLQRSSDAALQMFPLMHPALLPGMVPLQSTKDHPGIYAVPVLPFSGPTVGFPANTLIPLKYIIPTRENSGATGEEQGQARQQQGPQRQVVVRRFHFAFQLDLFLTIKLAALVFLLNPDGSRQKLVLLMFFASLFYLYQTGALNPFIRWIQQAGAPPQRRPPVQPDNGPPVARDDGSNPLPEENPAAENQNQNQNLDLPVENQDPAAANENQREPEGGNGFNWWGIVKEIQMFVVGFVISLLPGYHNND